VDLPATCPRCAAPFEVNDSVTEPGTRPVPGDVSICGHCRGIGIWVDGRTVRPATDDEVTDVTGRPGVQAALAALATVDDIPLAVAIARRVHARSN